jgi:hypothetical protein
LAGGGWLAGRASAGCGAVREKKKRNGVKKDDGNNNEIKTRIKKTKHARLSLFSTSFCLAFGCGVAA